jgi:hypothetical protein
VTVPNRIWVPAVAALALALGFAAALLIRAGGDPSLLVHAGPPWTSSESAPGSLTVQGPDDAFDGQFFYRLGVSPWSTEDRVAGVRNDLPALRNARWGYGALAFAGSGGDRDLVPWSLLGLNVVAAAAVGAIGGGLARAAGRHAAWGLALVLWPGFAYSLSLDTSELVASAFVLGGLLAVRHRRWPVAAGLLVAAVLTRDTTAVVPAGLAVASLWQLRSGGAPGDPARAAGDAPGPSPGAGPDVLALEVVETGPLATPERVVRGDGGGAAASQPRRDAVARLVVGFVALDGFVAWQVVQWTRFDALPLTSSGDNNLSAPFGGLVDLLRDSLPPGGGDEAFRVLCAAGLIALLAVAGWAWTRSAAPLGERVAWVGGAAVVVLLNAYLWSGATAFGRAATEAGLLSTLIVLGTDRRRLLPLVTAGLGGLWLLTAAAQVAKLG